MKKKASNQELVNKIMEKKRMTKVEAETWLSEVLLSNKELESIAGGFESPAHARSECTGITSMKPKHEARLSEKLKGK